jgi:hypothetical protein
MDENRSVAGRTASLAGLVILLLIAGHAAADDFSAEPWGIKPKGYMRVEVLAVGLGYALPYPLLDANVLSVEGEWHRFRLGACLLHVMAPEELSSLPISVGYTIWEHPKNYAGRLFEISSEGFIRFTADWGISEIDDGDFGASQGTLEFVMAGDRVGFGYAAAVGLKGTHVHCEWPSPTNSRSVAPFIEVWGRFPTLMAGF